MRLVAVIVAAVALLVLSDVRAPSASAQTGVLAGDIPATGAALVVFGGGTNQQLIAASGCPLETVAFYASAAGTFVPFIPGAAVSAVNAQWNARFPGGIPASTVLLARCAPEALPQPPPPPPPAAPPPPAPPPADSPGLDALRDALRAAVERYQVPGRYAVAVTDLVTGETTGVNATRRQLAGCSINLFVLMQAVLDVQHGRLAMGDIDELVRATTWSSATEPARELYFVVGDGDLYAGLSRVEVLIHQVLGLDQVVLDHPPAHPDESLGFDPNNWITAESMNRALAAIYSGNLYEPRYREYLLEVLHEVKPGLNYLVASVPGYVSHKNGFFWNEEGWIDNDAGIVQFPGIGGTYAYALTFLSEAVPEEYGDIPLGQTLSSLTWDWFHGGSTFGLRDDSARMFGLEGSGGGAAEATRVQRATTGGCANG